MKTQYKSFVSLFIKNWNFLKEQSKEIIKQLNIKYLKNEDFSIKNDFV